MKPYTSEYIKPLAPYGAILEQYLESNIPINFTPYFFVGQRAIIDCRQSLSAGIPALCLPPGDQITAYRWPIQGLRIILYDSGESALLEMKQYALYLLTNADASFITLLRQGIVTCYRNEKYYPDAESMPIGNN